MTKSLLQQQQLTGASTPSRNWIIAMPIPATAVAAAPSASGHETVGGVAQLAQPPGQ